MAFPLGAMLAGDPYSSYARSYQTATDQAGQEAAGKFLQQMFNAPMPGAQPMAMAPQAQAQAQQMPQGSLMQGLQRLPVVGGLFGGGQPQGPQQASMGGPMGGGGPPAQAMAMPPQPQMQRPPPQPQGMPQGGGQNPINAMSFPQLVQGLVRSNPGASSAQIFSALRQMAPAITPFMNAEALAQYRNAMLAQGEERIATTRRGQDIRAETAEQGQELSAYRQELAQYTLGVNNGTIDPTQTPPPQPPQRRARGAAPAPAQPGPPPAAAPTGDTWTPRPRPGYGPPPAPAAAAPAPGGPAPAAAAPAAADPMASARQQLAGDLQRAYAGGGGPQGYTPTPGTPQIARPGAGTPLPPAAAPPQVNVPMRPPAPQAPAPAAPVPLPQQIPRPGTLPPGAAPIAQTDQPRQSPIKNISDGLISGQFSPAELKNVPIKERALIINDLHKRGFDLALAQQEWMAADRITKSLAGPAMTRLFSTMDAVHNTIQMVRGLSQKLDMGNFTFKNRLDLESWAKLQSNTPKGQAAAQYLTATKALQDELAQVIAGGNSPTNRFLEQAQGMVNEAYGQKGLEASLDTVEQVIAYRKQALMAQGGGRVGGANPYLGKTDQPQQPATEGGGDGAPRPQSGGFDVEAARKAGYSQQEIDDYLKRRRRE